jgi:hypothetical protein
MTCEKCCENGLASLTSGTERGGWPLWRRFPACCAESQLDALMAWGNERRHERPAPEGYCGSLSAGREWPYGPPRRRTIPAGIVPGARNLSRAAPFFAMVWAEVPGEVMKARAVQARISGAGCGRIMGFGRCATAADCEVVLTRIPSPRLPPRLRVSASRAKAALL